MKSSKILLLVILLVALLLTQAPGNASAQATLQTGSGGNVLGEMSEDDVGDMVDVGGVFGKVDKMSLVSTTVLTIDNQTLVVPNKKIWGEVIKNVTAQDIRRVDIEMAPQMCV